MLPKHPLLKFIRLERFQQLIASCRKHPEDSVIRGVLADWLEENGEDEYAAYIRYESGIWSVSEGYNYNHYRKQLFQQALALFATDGIRRTTPTIINVGGLLVEYRQISLDNWLTFGKLAYAVGAIRWVEIRNTVWPMCRSNSTGSWSGGSRGNINYKYICDGFQITTSIHGNLYELIRKQIIDRKMSYIDHIGQTQPMTVLNTDNTEYKLTRIISNAAILHAKHAAINDGIACE